MLKPEWFVVVSDHDHDRYQLCKVVSALTKRLYLVDIVCPDHGAPTRFGMTVLDIKILAERHPEFGARGQIFETWEQYLEFYEPSDTPANEASAPQVH